MRRDDTSVHVWVEPADLPPALEAFRRLAGRPHPFFRVVAAPGHRGAAWSYLATDPRETLRIGTLGRPGAWSRRLAALAARPVVHHGPTMPFRAGWAGMLGYEARSGIEDRPPPRRPPLGLPSVWLGRYDAVAGWSARSGTYVSGAGSTPSRARERARRLARRLARRTPAAQPVHTGEPRALIDPASYRRIVRRAVAHVRAGDLFQVNVSQRFDAAFDGCAATLFEHLVRTQPAPYMTYVGLGGGRSVLSASPERFLRVTGRRVETDPMKGTRPRGATRAEDRRLREELETDEKEKAELAMIVDLSRNDLARVCDPGTIRVVVPRRLLRYRNVHQAIAVVRGRLAKAHDRVDLLAAAFPPGSITGAPKVRAMEIIDDLEGEGRGAYCGALGWLDEGGGLDLAVAIRTVVVSGRRASYRVGGGITLRSRPDAEWRETLAKGRGLAAALAGAS